MSDLLSSQVKVTRCQYVHPRETITASCVLYITVLILYISHLPDDAMNDTFTYIEGLCIYSQEEKDALFINKPTPVEKEYSFISELACEEVCVMSIYVIILLVIHSVITTSMPSPLMLWLFVSPGHQHPWYWPSRINQSIFLKSRKMREWKYISIFPNEWSAHQELINVLQIFQKKLTQWTTCYLNIYWATTYG